MNKILFIIISLFIFFSCKKDIQKIQLPTNNLFIVAYTYSYRQNKVENDSIYIYYNYDVYGYTEVDTNFNVKTVKRSNGWEGDYYLSKISISDSLKIKLSNTILRYPIDTVFTNYSSDIYDGPGYMIVAQGENNLIRIEGVRFAEDTRLVLDSLYQPDIYRPTESSILISNQDSIVQRASLFEQFVREEIKPKTHTRKALKFTP